MIKSMPHTPSSRPLLLEGFIIMFTLRGMKRYFLFYSQVDLIRHQVGAESGQRSDISVISSHGNSNHGFQSWGRSWVSQAMGRQVMGQVMGTVLLTGLPRIISTDLARYAYLVVLVAYLSHALAFLFLLMSPSAHKDAK